MGRRPGDNGGGGKPFARLERFKREKAEREQAARDKKAADEARRRERAARHAESTARKAAERAAQEAARRSAGPDGALVGPDGDATPFGVDRRKLQRKARMLGFHSIEPIKGLRPISDAASRIGKKKFIEMISLAVMNRDPDATAWWRTYEGMDAYERDITKVHLDEVTMAAGVRPDALLKAVVGAAVTFGAHTNELIFAVTHPQVIKSMATSATRINPALPDKVLEIAHKDRVAFLQGSGALKQRGGPSINITTRAEAKSAAAAKSEAASGDASVPSFLDDVIALDRPKADVQKALQGTMDVETAE